MQREKLLFNLIEALKRLPGVGSKTAVRMALHLLEHDREGAKKLAEALFLAGEKLRACTRCRALTESRLCSICSDPKRDDRLLCVVENLSDLWAIERATDYRGKFFVLKGRLSPLDGIGPKELQLDQLEELLKEGKIEELIIATSPTPEGEATAFYIAEMARPYRVKLTRIAYGVPVGGELEYLDSHTLTYAFRDRRPLTSE